MIQTYNNYKNKIKNTACSTTKVKREHVIADALLASSGEQYNMSVMNCVNCNNAEREALRQYGDVNCK